ncbi:hypothetical protein FOA43_003494 [Brettanomyces nanus]|uniref:RING-type E3 ubiquitin transferase n=1 Tax=Eeniella nana TaxID=13502 RepID=A0A875S574_EENNA|nr:uncharacterized protein FOA43_003494 [Brettanomyces nanus]QPG76108.1 hypothetical protein FOA43_003494 [Brettanomyces nanus]
MSSGGIIGGNLDGEESNNDIDDSIKISPELVTTVEISNTSSRMTVNDDIDGDHNEHRKIRQHRKFKYKSADDDDENLCPVCGKDIKALQDIDRVDHVNECLESQEFSGSPDQVRKRNRMLVYTIPKDADVLKLKLNEDSECVICFEEFKPGNKIGRLECLCCFHYECIKDWINHKGRCECPVHMIHYDI